MAARLQWNATVTLNVSTRAGVRTSSDVFSSSRLQVSMMTMGTPSGVASACSRVGGSTGGGESGKDSVAAAVMRLVLPTPCASAGACQPLETC